MLIIIFFAVVAGLAATLYLFLSYRHSSWKRKGVAGPPASPLGITGHILGKEHYGDVSDRIYKQFRKSPIAGNYVLARPVLHLHDPEIIKQVLIKEFQDFNGRGITGNFDYDPLAQNLFSLEGSKWRNLRVKLAPTFTSGKIKYMFETIKKSSQQMAEYIDDNIEASGGSYCEDARPLMTRLFVDTTSQVIFGIESNVVRNPNSEFHKAINRAVAPTMANAWRALLATFASDIMSLLRVCGASADTNEFFTTLVRKTVQYREENNVDRADMLNLLIQLKNQGFVVPDRDDKKEDVGQQDAKQKLKIDDIAAQVFLFFIAGFHTSASTASFTLYEMAKNPEILETALNEVDRVLAEFGGKITYESITNMPYLEMCVSETLRKYPPLAFITRQAMVTRKLPLTDVVVEKGTRLVVPVRALHYDPEYWPEPERYDPERFSEKQKVSRPPGLVYLPFGDGPRICIAGRLGVVQVKTALVTLLSKYTVSIQSTPRSKVSMNPRSFATTPNVPLDVLFKPRVPAYGVHGKAA